jgi:hypothetical protein
LLRSRGPRAWPVRDRRITVQSKLTAQALERILQGRNGAIAIGHQRNPVRRQLQVPGRKRLATRAAGADPGQQRIALRQRLCVGPPGSHARRPQCGDELVEVTAAQRGRALDQL